MVTYQSRRSIQKVKEYLTQDISAPYTYQQQHRILHNCDAASPFDALSDGTLQQLVNNTQLLTMPNGAMVFKRDDERTQCHGLVKRAIDLVAEDYKTLHITDANDVARYMLDENSHCMHTAVATITMLTSDVLMQRDNPDFNTLLAEPASEYVTAKEVQAVINAGK